MLGIERLAPKADDWKGANASDALRVIRYAFDWRTALAMLFFVGLACLEVWAGNELGMYPSKMFSAIATRDLDSMSANLWRYCAIIVGMAALIAFKLWVADVISVFLRKKLVGGMQAKYMKDNAFYEVLLHEYATDNPDGRITNDPLNWVQLLISVIVDVTASPIYICWYGYKTIDLMGWRAAAICAGFAVFSVVVSRIVMTPIIRLTYLFEAANADYRLTNALIHGNGETIALSRGQIHEKQLLNRMIDSATGCQFRLANYNILLNVVTHTCNYFGNGLVYICIYACTPTGLSPAEVGRFVGLVSFYTINFIYGLTMIMKVAQNFAKFCGYSTRIQELWHFVFTHVRSVKPPIIDNEIRMNRVNILHPSGSLLCGNVSFAVKPEGGIRTMLIKGPSGSGKSSIFRVLGELWPAGSGDVTVPGHMNMLVMTQKPFLPDGTIREVCAFPRSLDEVDASKINEILVFLELSHLLQRPSATWSNGLSPGERQRVALARMFIHEPKFLLLDEATSAIPEALETRVYDRLARSQTVFISIAHRQRLKAFHQATLTLDGLGGYEICANEDGRPISFSGN